jgi:hypothetical protein
VAQYGRTPEVLARAVELLKQQKIGAVPFEQAYLDAGMTFTSEDIETVRFLGGIVHVLFWFGNSNRFWPFTDKEWNKK